MPSKTFLIILLWGITLINYAICIVHTSCEDGMIAYEGNCYLIGHTDLKFVEAEHFCRQHHAHVVEPYNTLENNFIKDQFRYLKPHCYWIGATDEIAEDTWRWYSSGNLMNFTDWYPGQPGSDVGDEDCLAFWISTDYKWVDAPCSYLCFPVCKLGGFGGEGAELIG